MGLVADRPPVQLWLPPVVRPYMMYRKLPHFGDNGVAAQILRLPVLARPSGSDGKLRASWSRNGIEAPGLTCARVAS
jgi:hypothetical protein